jgi:hypothetical protein
VKVRPRVRTTLRALSGRRILIEGFGRRSPVYVAIIGGDRPEGAWLSPATLRRLVETGRRILK